MVVLVSVGRCHFVIVGSRCHFVRVLVSLCKLCCFQCQLQVSSVNQFVSFCYLYAGSIVSSCYLYMLIGVTLLPCRCRCHFVFFFALFITRCHFVSVSVCMCHFESDTGSSVKQVLHIGVNWQVSFLSQCQFVGVTLLLTDSNVNQVSVFLVNATPQCQLDDVILYVCQLVGVTFVLHIYTF